MVGGLTATVAAALLLMIRPPGPGPVPAVVVATASGHAIVDGAVLTASADRPTLLQFRRPATARLAPGARARLRSVGGGDRVELMSGAVGVEVAPGAYTREAPFAVQAGGFSVTVVGTAFDVEVAPTGVLSVAVERGVVEVSGPGLIATRVAAGRCWTSAQREVLPCDAPESPPPDGSPPAAAQPDPPARPSQQRSMRAKRPAEVVAPQRPGALKELSPYDDAEKLLAERNYIDAAERFAAIAAGDGPMASTALYELGVIQAERLGRAGQARSSFEAYQARFPAGPLRPEVDLGRLQALVSLGLNDAALQASSKFLQTYPGSRRGDEVRTMRGDTLHALGRHGDAVAEYDGVGAGRFAGQAAWGAAVCLTDAGRKEQARQRVRNYLQRFPNGPFAGAARKALNNESLNAGPPSGHSGSTRTTKDD